MTVNVKNYRLIILLLLLALAIPIILFPVLPPPDWDEAAFIYRPIRLADDSKFRTADYLQHREYQLRIPIGEMTLKEQLAFEGIGLTIKRYSASHPAPPS